MTEEEYKQKIIMMLNDIHSIEKIEEIYTVVMWYFINQSKRDRNSWVILRIFDIIILFVGIDRNQTLIGGDFYLSFTFLENIIIWIHPTKQKEENWRTTREYVALRFPKLF